MRVAGVCGRAVGVAMGGLLALAGPWGGALAGAQTCTTQSAMKAADRDELAAAARGVAQMIQSNDQAGLRGVTTADLQRNFAGVTEVVTATAPKLKGGVAEVEQVYVLSAPGAAGGAASDTQFFCALNGKQAEADFTIPQLPPGQYGFAMVRVQSAPPWRISMLLQQAGGWKLAGLYPKPLEAAGHDGLWYWTQARVMTAKRQSWNAWLYYQQAQMLLSPAGFVSSTHLEKLQTELAGAAPPAVVGGLTTETPLVVKGPEGTEYRFSGLGVDDSLRQAKVDVAAHLKVDQLGDAAAARRRNTEAMAALLRAYPELREAFHGVWIFAEVAGQSPYATEAAMNEIR